MRRFRPLLILLLSGIAGPTLADPEAFRVTGLPRDEALSIREGPDVGEPVVAEVPVGRRLIGFGCTNDTPSGHTWCRVKYGDAIGWARRRYLAPD